MFGAADRHFWSHELLFLPESLAVEAVLMTPDALLHAFSTERDDSEVSKETIQFYARWLHEEDHLRRMTGTAYGLLCHHIRSGIFRGVVEHVSGIQERGEMMEFPLLANSDGIRGRLVEIQCALNALQSTVEGREFQLAQDYFQDIARAGGVEFSDFKPLPPFRETAFSGQPLTVNGETRVMTGVHLLEFFAIGEEENVSVGILDDSQHTLNLRRSLSYSFVSAAWFAMFGTDTVADSPDQPEGEGSRAAWAYRIFPSEVYAMADLALWPPFGPGGFVAPSNGSLRWADVQPGARFLAALAVLRDKDVKFTPIAGTSDARTEAVESVQALVCRELGWPSPKSLCLEWGEFFAQGDVGDFERLFHDSPTSHRSDATRRLLEFRNRSAGDLVFNMYDKQEADLPHAVAFLAPADQFDLQLVPIMDGDPVDSLRDFELYHGFQELAYAHCLSQKLLQLEPDDRIRIGGRVLKELRRMGVESEVFLRLVASRFGVAL